MVERFSSLLKKDLITGFRNYFFYIIIFVAVLFVGIISFVIPENASIKPTVYYYSEYKGEMEDNFNRLVNEGKDKGEKIQEVSSKTEIITLMKNNFNSIGILVKMDNGEPLIEFIVQGHENPKVVNTLVLAMKDQLNYNSTIKGINTIILNKEVVQERIPLNKSILPLFVLMEPSMLGFLLIAALIFMEKDEGTIKAYNVTPGRIPEYLASKIFLMIVLGWISTLISTALIVGFNYHIVMLFLLVTLGSILFSSLGLIVASFFDNLSQSIIWVIIINLLLGFPFVSYFVPSFAPVFVKLLPTYPLLFAIREAIFPTGNSTIIYSTLVTFVILGLLSYLLAIFAYQRNMARN